LLILMNKSLSFTDKFITGEAYFWFWNLVSKGIGFVNTFFIISSLSIYEYGVFQLLLATYNILSDVISTGGGAVGNDVLRLIGGGKEDKAKRLFYEYNRWRVGLSILFFAAFFFGAPLLSFRYGPDFIRLIQILSVLFLVEIFLLISKSILKMRLYFKEVASRSAIGKLVQLAVLAYFFFYAALGTREVLISMIAASFLSTLFQLPSLLRAYRPWRGLATPRESLLFPLLKSHGKWAILRQFASDFSNKIKPWLIKLFISTEAVGVFSVATQMVNVFKTFLPTNTLATLVPRSLTEQARMKNIFVFGTKYLVLLGIVFVLAGWVAGPVAVGLFFEQYVVSLPFFFVLMLLLPIQSFWRIVDIYLVAFQAQKFFFFRTGLRAGLSFLSLLIFLPLFGLWGVVIHDLMIPLVMSLVSYYYLFRIRPIFWFSFKSIFSFGTEDKIMLKNLYNNFIRLLKIKLKLG